MTETRIVVGGIPTTFDVEKLEEHFASPQPGDLISYESIEKVIGLSRNMNRFRTVTTVWRKKLFRERNIYVASVANEGFRILTNAARVSEATKKVNRGLKGIKKGEVISIRTGRSGLSQEENRRLDNLQRFTAALQLTAATEAKKLQMPDPEIKRLAAISQ